MAKEKIRKLVKEREILIKDVNTLNNRLENVVAMLAYLAHKNGGQITFTEQDILSTPDAAFNINATNGVYTLKLTYPEPESPINKHLEAVAEMEKAMITST